jgi:hypothetical protein
VAVEVAYRDVPADGAPPTISRVYIERATPAVAEQIKKAGVRLATVLNAALAMNLGRCERGQVTQGSVHRQ